jgi:DNA repair exonuclease SbcCD ATPase subunit
MLTVVEIKRKLQTVFDEQQARVLAEVVIDAYTDLVKTSDFNELKGIVKELAKEQKALAEAQKRTEQRVAELAEAQQRTEQRVAELTEAQQRTEQRVAELAEAQKRTEQRVEELAEAQKRTEQRVEELAVALRQLTEEHAETRRQVGGLAMTVGYRLEDEAFKALPALLHQDFGIIVQDRLRRRFVTDNRGQPLEVNIIGDALRDSQAVVIVGESKSQLSKNKVDEFVQKKLKRLEGVFKAEMFPVLVTYMISEPDVEEYMKAQGIALYYSYDF